MSPVSHKHARLLGQRLGALLSARRPAEGALPPRLERSDRTHPEPAARVPPQADTRLLPGGDVGWGDPVGHSRGPRRLRFSAESRAPPFSCSKDAPVPRDQGHRGMHPRTLDPEEGSAQWLRATLGS